MGYWGDKIILIPQKEKRFFLCVVHNKSNCDWVLLLNLYIFKQSMSIINQIITHEVLLLNLYIFKQSISIIDQTITHKTFYFDYRPNHHS